MRPSRIVFFLLFVFFTDGVPNSKLVKKGKKPNSQAEVVVEPKITGCLFERGHKSLDGEVGCKNVMIELVAILIDGPIRGISGIQ